MKDRREDFYFNNEDKKMLASNLAASLNIPPDITITAVSVSAKPSTPPPPKYGYQNSIMHPNSSSPSIPMNLAVNSPMNLNAINQNSPLTVHINSSSNQSNRNSPMNFSHSSPSNQMNSGSINQSSSVNLNVNNQSALNLNNQNYQVSENNQIVAQTSPSNNLPQPTPGPSKYSQLLDVIEEMGKDVRPTYSGSKSSAERLRRSIGLARILIRQCIMETEPNIKQ